MQHLLSGALGGASGGSALERELTLGFELDHKRRVEDDMKKRAIQTAGSYEQFRQLVAAASQKPLTPADYATRAAVGANKARAGEPRALGLGLSLGGEGEDEGGGGSAGGGASVLLGGGVTASENAAAATGFGSPPGSPAEFERTWRRLPPSRRLAYVLWLGPQRLGHAFRCDIDGSMLGPLLLLLGSDACEEGCAGSRLALGLVSAVPASSLGLALDLLNDEERAAGRTVVQMAELAGLEGAQLLRRCLC